MKYPKPPKPRRDPAHLARVRELPCCICEAFGEPQRSPTAAHHTMEGRGAQRRSCDYDAIPLCDGHHQGLFDLSKLRFHGDRNAWVQAYGLDTDYIKPTQAKLAEYLPARRERD